MTCMCIPRKAAYLRIYMEGKGWSSEGKENKGGHRRVRRIRVVIGG